MASSAAMIADKEISASQWLPFSYHITDDVISTKNGEYMSVWRLEGRSHVTASIREHFQWAEDLNAFLRGQPYANLALYSHMVRRRVSEYPDSDFENGFVRGLDQKYRAKFDRKSSMINELYLSVVFRPVTDKALSLFAMGERPKAGELLRRQDEALAKLGEVNLGIAASMRAYRPQLLKAVPRLNGEDVELRDEKGAIKDPPPGARMFSQALEHFAQIINGERVAVPVCRDRIADYLNTNRVLFGTHGEIGEVRTSTGPRYFGMMDIAEYPANTEPGQLNELMEAPYEFVLTQSFVCQERHGAKAFMERQQKHLQDAKDAGRRQIVEISDALDAITAGELVMGQYHGTLMVYGDTPGDVRKNLAEGGAVIVDHGLIAKRCDLTLEAAFWAQMPGAFRHRPRPATLSSRNFLSFSPFHNFMTGKPTGNPWGPAVTMFETSSSAPLFFSWQASNPHSDETDKRLLGNTAILGQSGAGKTVLLNFLVAMSQKFSVRMACFDKDRGTEILIRAIGGKYLPLKTGEPSGFNPLRLPLTAANLSFLKSFLKLLISVEGEKVSHRDDVQIDGALKALALLEPKDRRIVTLLEALPNPRGDDSGRPSVAARLRKWSAVGELGWLFDNDDDVLDVTTHSAYGFDVTEFLENPITRGPLMTYLLYRTEAMIDGQPFMYVFDEFWKALQDPQFADFARDKAKTIRKKNGILVFATQEVGDALNSNIGKTLVSQCATMILLPNRAGDRADYLDGLKISETEFEIVSGLSEDSRSFLVKQGGRSAIGKLDLAGFDDELLVLSGTPDNAERVERIINDLAKDIGPEEANQWEAWSPLFLQQVRSERAR